MDDVALWEAVEIADEYRSARKSAKALRKLAVRTPEQDAELARLEGHAASLLADVIERVKADNPTHQLATV